MIYTQVFRIQHIQISKDVILNRQFWFLWPNFPKKGTKILVYRKYHIPKLFSCHEIHLIKKYSHPIHSLKMIFENSTKVEMTNPFQYLCP